MRHVSAIGTRGFTLIELLVVIAIIGLLSSIVLASLSTARTKSFNVQRVTSLQGVQTALELYFQDHGYYPRGVAGYSTTGTEIWYSQCPIGYQVANANNVIPGLTPKYVTQIPVDPQMDSSAAATCCYAYNSTAVDYKFVLYNCKFTNYLTYTRFLDPARDQGPDSCVIDPPPILLPNQAIAWGVYTDGYTCI